MTESMLAKKGNVEFYGSIFKLHNPDADIEYVPAKRVRPFVSNNEGKVQTPGKSKVDRAVVKPAVKEHKEREQAEAERLERLEAEQKKAEEERKKKRNAKSKANKKNKKLRKQAEAEQNAS